MSRPLDPKEAFAQQGRRMKFQDETTAKAAFDLLLSCTAPSSAEERASLAEAFRLAAFASVNETP